MIKKPLEILEKEGYEAILNPYGRKLKKEEVIELCRNATGIIAGTERIDADTLEILAKNVVSQSLNFNHQHTLKVVSRCGAGIDNVDIDTAERLGIKVFNTPDAPVLAVAELTVGLILDLLRKVSQMDKEFKDDKWQKRMGTLLFGKKIGIKGFGRIGKKIAELLIPFGCEVAYADPYVEDGMLGLKRLSLEELLDWADIISIHVSVSEKLIGEKEFKLIKKGAWLINTSRGGVADEAILYEYLKSGYLSGAALDVFEDEPYIGPLKELDNIILTPHIGSYAKEARVRMEMEAVENLIKGLRN